MPSKKMFSLLVLLTFIAGPTVMAQTVMQEDVAAITAVSKARAEAFNQANAKEIASYFTEDAVLMAPGESAAIGTEAVREYYQDIFDSFDVDLESHYEEVEVFGDMAYGRGEAIVRLTPRNGGKSTVASSKYLNILKRQPDGSWMTTHDIWNDNDKIP
ncbi:YybH family protein [Maribacter halichondriae]|uniref:YybH family protein n=1 Tax=Maribacter halichondriae TaxID=2980554 RepID=UPI002359863D|nr:SgcJ/EcaC family oxidoreductase [Maribacter sp. Hal144]